MVSGACVCVCVCVCRYAPREWVEVSSDDEWGLCVCVGGQLFNSHSKSQTVHGIRPLPYTLLVTNFPHP